MRGFLASEGSKIIANPIVPIRAAATVVILRDGDQGIETLLLRRNSKLAFAAGAWVFPGGSVDQADANGGIDEMEVAKNAAIREAKEECGLRLASEDLVYFCKWTTPEGDNKRFATWFFVSVLREPSATVTIDGSEIHEHKWLSPQRALDDHQADKFNLMPPTYMSLRLIRHFQTAQQVSERLLQRRPYDVTPKLCQYQGNWICLYPGDAGYEESNCNIEGPRHRTLIENGTLRYEHSGDNCPEPAMDAP